jgi:lipopolysaccharide export system permease protein
LYCCFAKSPLKLQIQQLNGELLSYSGGSFEGKQGMNGFTRYVFWQLFVGMVFMTAGLTSVIWLSQSLRFVELIVNRGVSVSTFAYLIILMLPNFLTIILPIALFCVIVFTYTKLIADRELVVMRAAGVSQTALAKPAVILALATVTLSYALNLNLVPNSYSMFRALQWDIRYNYSHILLKEGAFTDVIDGVTVYVRERANDGQLLGILVHDQRVPSKPITLMASKGALVVGDKGTRVAMFTGSRQSVDTKTKKLSILYFDRYVIDLGKNKGSTEGRDREARERSLNELLDIKNAKGVADRDIGKFIVEAHKRLFSSLYPLGYTMIALACLISGGFSRRNQNRQVLLSVLLMVAVQATALGLENVVSKNLNLIPLLYAHAIFPILFGWWIAVTPIQFRRAIPQAATG